MKTTKAIKYKETSKYPSVNKDVSFVVNINTSSLEIMELIKKTAGRILTNIEVFDVYMGDKIEIFEKSIAFSLTFSDITRTLTDEEINILLEKIIKDVTNKGNCRLRNF